MPKSRLQNWLSPCRWEGYTRRGQACATVLRQWPLSGVLSTVVEPPDFAGHAGLLLYAERLAVNTKPAWLAEGPVREYVELVFAERGQRLPVCWRHVWVRERRTRKDYARCVQELVDVYYPQATKI